MKKQIKQILEAHGVKSPESVIITAEIGGVIETAIDEVFDRQKINSVLNNYNKEQ